MVLDLEWVWLENVRCKLVSKAGRVMRAGNVALALCWSLRPL